MVGGFVYDALFAGIPYQDATPEMQARYDHHADVAAKMMRTGFVTLVTGSLSLVAIKIISKKDPIRHDARV